MQQCNQSINESSQFHYFEGQAAGMENTITLRQGLSDLICNIILSMQK